MTTQSRQAPPKQIRLKPSDRRASIQNLATGAFAERGFHETSMTELAVATGVTPAVIYRHFDSKDDLYRAALDRIATGYRDAEVFAPASGGVTIDVTQVLEAGREDPAGFKLFWHHAARETEFALLPATLRSEAVDTLAATLRERAGRADLTQWAAQATVGYVIDSVLTWLEFGDPSRDEKFCDATTAAMRAGVQAWSLP